MRWLICLLMFAGCTELAPLDTSRPLSVVPLASWKSRGHAKLGAVVDTVTFTSLDGTPLFIARQGANNYTFINVKNYFGTVGYQAGFTFALEQGGVWIINLPALTQTFRPNDDDLVIRSPGDALPFRVIAYPNLLNYWFTDEFLNPIYDPCWVYEVRPL